MDNLNELLSSISPSDMEKIKGAAASLLGTSADNPADTNAADSSPTSAAPAFSDDMSRMLMQLAAQMNKDNDKTAFIKALRPLLSEERQKKADEAMRFMKLMDTLPLLRGMF